MNNADDTNIPLEQLGHLHLNEGDNHDHPIPRNVFNQGELHLHGDDVFNQDALHLHNHDIVIQNGGKRNRNLTSTEGFNAYTEMVENSLAGYNASTNKKLFVIGYVIDPLLNEGRRFYVKRGNLYELIDLTDDNTKCDFALKVIQKMRDSNKRLRASTQHEEGKKQGQDS